MHRNDRLFPHHRIAPSVGFGTFGQGGRPGRIAYNSTFMHATPVTCVTCDSPATATARSGAVA
ncbi:hypothetical protein SAMN05421773_101825 [Streptomyces aidingensis]|uniref:Uncharacterized protein n=1 Tax=Streptomyces aidingensis TaxID=910347 RepID=A0A1I1FQ16_9ACTN|nr:hypothetical protein SAMN05421773_101825 [Streptomyces aidingensis]